MLRRVKTFFGLEKTASEKAADAIEMVATSANSAATALADGVSELVAAMDSSPEGTPLNKLKEAVSKTVAEYKAQFEAEATQVDFPGFRAERVQCHANQGIIASLGFHGVFGRMRGESIEEEMKACQDVNEALTIIQDFIKAGGKWNIKGEGEKYTSQKPILMQYLIAQFPQVQKDGDPTINKTNALLFLGALRQYIIAAPERKASFSAH